MRHAKSPTLRSRAAAALGGELLTAEDPKRVFELFESFDLRYLLPSDRTVAILTLLQAQADTGKIPEAREQLALARRQAPNDEFRLACDEIEVEIEVRAGNVDLARRPIGADVVRFKDGPQTIVFLLRNRIVFVIVAAGALKRHADERFARVFNGLVQPHVPIKLVPIAG